MATVIAPAVAFGDRTVTARYFGTGNASRTIWSLACMDSDRALLAPVIYRKDWQMPGHYQLYSTSRTNLLLRSQALATAPWSVFNVGSSNPTVTNNADVAPDGTTTATSIVFPTTGAGASSGVRQNVTGLANPTTLRPSIWLKASSACQISIRQGNGGAGYEAKSVTTSWQRFSATAGSNASTSFNFDIVQAENSTTVTVYAWGGQLESGSTTTPYIPTVAATASVTDYSTDANGKVTFAAAPVLAADVAYLDPWMGTAVYKSFGTGDGSNTQFSLPWKPVAPSIYIDGVLQTLTTHYTVTPGGTVTFVTPPGNGTVLTWTGNMGVQR